MIGFCAFCLENTKLENFKCLLCKNLNLPLGKYNIVMCKNCIEKHCEKHTDFVDESHMGTHFRERYIPIADVSGFL